MMEIPSRKRCPHTYHGLNALRGIAAISVAVLHFTEGFRIYIPTSGVLAVDLFFLMSGFVIGHAYDDRLARGMKIRSFMRARLLRFYPLYLLAMTLAAIRIAGLVATHAPTTKLAELFVSFGLGLFFLPSPPGPYNGLALYPLNAPTWSLGDEIVINFFYALLHRWLRMILLSALIAAAFLVLVVASFSGSVMGGSLWDDAYFGFARGIFSFGLGILLYRNRDKLGSLPRFAAVTPIVLVLALSVKFQTWQSAYEIFFVSMLSPLIVAAGTGKMPKWSEGVCTFLGRTSYPLYVIHMPLYILTTVAIAKRQADPLTVALCSLGFLLCVCWYL